MSEQELKQLIESLGGKEETVTMPDGGVLHIYKLKIDKEEDKDEKSDNQD